MNRIKSAARREAWSDPRNPFDRFPGSHFPGSQTAPSFGGTGNANVLRPLHETRSANDIRPIQRSSDILTGPPVFKDDKAKQSPAADGPDVESVSIHASEEGRIRRRFFGIFPRIISDEDLSTELGLSSRRIRKLKRRAHKRFTVQNQVQSLILSSWVRILLLLTPIGFGVHYAHFNSTTDFLVNFFAVLPLTDMFGQALVEFKMYTADPRLELIAYVLCGNINQTFASAFLLYSDQVSVLKSTLLGGMLLRILLVTSIAIVTNDSRHRFQRKSIAISLSKHLAIAVTGLIIPTALSMVTTPVTSDVSKQSRGVSIVLLILYCLYLYSEWNTYSLLGLQLSSDKKKQGEGIIKEKGRMALGVAVIGAVMAAVGRPSPDMPPPPPPPPDEPIDELMDVTASEEEEGREPQLHIWISVITLIVMAVLLALHILFMSDSVNGISKETGMSKEFIGLILFPILGVDSTLLHLDNRYDSEEATQSTLGLGLQVILFLTPVLVLVGWARDIKDMNLQFSPFEVTVLFPAVLVVQASVEENEHGWLSGALLFGTYLTIAIAAWFQD